jgi:hypothetical protein
MAAVDAGQVAWWREPTKDQWYAWWAAWLGWTLDAFDFTVFLLIIKPIADEFGVPTTEVTIVFTLTPSVAAMVLTSCSLPRNANARFPATRNELVW